MAIFIGRIKVRPMPGCELDPKDAGGAFVHVYISAPSESKAIARMQRALAEDRYRPIEIEWFVNHEVKRDEQVDTDALARIDEAAQADSVVYGEYYCWPARDSDE